MATERVTTRPTRSGEGVAIMLGSVTVAWVDPSGNGHLGRRYRATLNGKDPDPRVVAAMQKAIKAARKAAGTDA